MSKPGISKRMLLLVIGIPLSSVAMGIVLITLAINRDSDWLPAPENSLNKTSWQDPE